MRRASVTAAVLSGLAIGLAGVAEAGPPQRKPAVRWASSWEEAVAEAKARSVPIFVSFHMDH